MVPAKFSTRTNCSRRAKVLDEQVAKIKEKFSSLELKHRKKDCIGNFQFIPFSLLLCSFKSNSKDPWGVTFINYFRE